MRAGVTSCKAACRKVVVVVIVVVKSLVVKVRCRQCMVLLLFYIVFVLSVLCEEHDPVTRSSSIPSIIRFPTTPIFVLIIPVAFLSAIVSTYIHKKAF